MIMHILGDVCKCLTALLALDPCCLEQRFHSDLIEMKVQRSTILRHKKGTWECLVGFF